MNKTIFRILTAALLAGAVAQAAPTAKTPLKPLPPVKMNGKAFFPIGVYDLAHSGTPGRLRLGDVDPKLYEIGVNAAFFGNLSIPGNKRYPGYEHIRQAFERARKDPRFSSLALIVNLDADIYCAPDPTLTGKARRKFRPLSDGEREARKKYLAEAFAFLSEQPNVIGYSVDEPENTFTNYFRSHRPKDDIDSGIGHALIEYLGWIKPVIDQYHPGAMQMPVIAWWGTYKTVSPIYDVLIANQYPKHPDPDHPVEFSAPLYEVSFDAARAVAAARASGKTVIYMPPSYDRLAKWPAHTFKEMRYMLFAPVTRGAMGIMTWRLNRCSQQFRDQVLYPAIRELARFHDYYLGSWHDELVVSDHDTATADYLKKFAVRDELLADVKVGKKKVVTDFVPDVSFCLRRKADGSWMLLAVNNRREVLTAEFLIDLAMPGEVTEALAGRTVKVAGRVIKDQFGPFDVKVYLWKEK